MQVEATKFTEVGYHGRDVDQIIRDLVETSMGLVKKRCKKAAAKMVSSVWGQTTPERGEGGCSTVSVSTVWHVLDAQGSERCHSLAAGRREVDLSLCVLTHGIRRQEASHTQK